MPKSEYHTRLDATETNDTTKHQEANLVVEPHADDSTIRFWSDYNRVFFHPRTIQRLPDLPNPEAAQGDWEMGREEFGRLEEVRMSEDPGPDALVTLDCRISTSWRTPSDRSWKSAITYRYGIIDHYRMRC